MKKEGIQSSCIVMAKEVLINMLVDPLFPVCEKIVVEMRKEMNKLENLVLEVMLTINQTAVLSIDKTLSCKVTLMEELVLSSPTSPPSICHAGYPTISVLS